MENTTDNEMDTKLNSRLKHKGFLTVDTIDPALRQYTRTPEQQLQGTRCPGMGNINLVSHG